MVKAGEDRLRSGTKNYAASPLADGCAEENIGLIEIILEGNKVKRVDRQKTWNRGIGGVKSRILRPGNANNL